MAQALVAELLPNRRRLGGVWWASLDDLPLYQYTTQFWEVGPQVMLDRQEIERADFGKALRQMPAPVMIVEAASEKTIFVNREAWHLSEQSQEP